MRIQNESEIEKEHILKEIMKLEGVSARQLARITGILPV